MGVIHKLRDDVITTIIAHKRRNSAIGVRKLAALISEEFQIKISKSSVSIVLKEASLSSAVGRRTGSGLKARKFSIPAMKKEEMAINMGKADFASVEPVAKQEKKEIQPRQSSIRRVDQWRGESKDQTMTVADGMGFVFLKAAQWEISKKPFMEKLLEKYVGPAVSKRFGAVSDMFLFSQFLGAKTYEHALAYRGHGLWVLNNFCSSNSEESQDLSELQKLFQWAKAMKEVPSTSNIIMEYIHEKEQAFLEVSGFKLLLEDKSSMIIDAAMSSFGAQETARSSAEGTLPINKALTWLSNRLISNIQSAVFHKVPGGEKFDQVFYEIAAAFGNMPGKRICKAMVLNDTGEEIAAFSTIPAQRRTFLIGVGPEQEEFTQLTKTVKWAGKKPFCSQETNENMHFTETKTDFMTRRLGQEGGQYRVITVWREEETDPCWMILTNQSAGSGQDILKMYLSRWPYFDGSAGSAVLPTGQENHTGEFRVSGLSGMFTDFVEALHQYCQRHFFPKAHDKIDISQFITGIYGIPGSFCETKKAITVRLDAGKACLSRHDLEVAVQRINGRHIFDHRERRLWLEIG